MSELTCVISPLTIHYLPVCNYVINSFSSPLDCHVLFIMIPIWFLLMLLVLFGTKIVLSILLGPGQSVVLEITSSIMSFSAKHLFVVLIGVDLTMVEI